MKRKNMIKRKEKKRNNKKHWRVSQLFMAYQVTREDRTKNEWACCAREAGGRGGGLREDDASLLVLLLTRSVYRWIAGEQWSSKLNCYHPRGLRAPTETTETMTERLRKEGRKKGNEENEEESQRPGGKILFHRHRHPGMRPRLLLSPPGPATPFYLIFD